MYLELKGNYYLKVEFSGNVLPLTPSSFKSLTITHDIDRLVPSFKLVLVDTSGILSHIVPFDSAVNNISIEIGKTLVDSEEKNEFEFLIKRRIPLGNNLCELSGLLNVPNLFRGTKSRGFNSNIKNILTKIVKEELNIEQIDISNTLSYKGNILQPNWTNARFFSWLQKELLGRGNEAGYYCTIKNIASRKIFFLKSLDEILISPTAYNFLVGEKIFEDSHYPILQYKIYDNSSIFVDYISKEKKYYYFDYFTGNYKSKSINIKELASLSDLFLVNETDTAVAKSNTKYGRTNEFCNDFTGKAKNNFYNVAQNLIQMFALTHGLPNIAPGSIVKVIFGEALQSGQMFNYQHNGFWMVKRVVHSIDATYRTNMLLSRSGVDTPMQTSLVESSKARKTI